MTLHTFKQHLNPLLHIWCVNEQIERLALSRISPWVRVRVSFSITLGLATGSYSWIRENIHHRPMLLWHFCLSVILAPDRNCRLILHGQSAVHCSQPSLSCQCNQSAFQHSFRSASQSASILALSQVNGFFSASSKGMWQTSNSKVTTFGLRRFSTDSKFNKRFKHSVVKFVEKFLLYDWFHMHRQPESADKPVVFLRFNLSHKLQLLNVQYNIVLLRCQDLATRLVAVVFWTEHRGGHVGGLQCSRQTEWRTSTWATIISAL